MTCGTTSAASRTRRRLAAALAGAALALLPALAPAGDLVLAVRVDAPAAATRARFAPLAEHLAESIGRGVRLDVAQSALAHWNALRGGAPADVAIEEAHFADYRVRRRGWVLVARLPGATAFALVTAPGRVVIDLEELHGRRVATLAAPAFAPLRLLALFPDPVRAPVLLEAPTYDAALARLVAGEVAAALVPADLVERRPGLNRVLATEQAPNPAVSVAPATPQPLRVAIERALLDAAATPGGRRALSRLGVAGFERAAPALYDGLARTLRGTLGYE